MTLTGPAALPVGCLDGARIWDDELLRVTNSGQPKTVEVGKVVTGTPCTLALYDWVSPEILEAATGRRQRLSTTLIACSRALKRSVLLVNRVFLLRTMLDRTHQEERVSLPQTPPARWAHRHRVILTMKRHRGRNGLANYTPANVGSNLLAKEWHHGYGSRGGEPIGFIVATGEVTGGFVAVGERHGGENRETGASLAYREKKRE